MKVIRLNKRPELLAPAGDLEKLAFAYAYGADAAYVGAGEWSLRTTAGMGLEELRQGVTLANTLGKKLYLALNVFAHNQDIERLPAFLAQIAEIKPHGVIISDPGVFTLAKQYLPHIPIHISTQANNTNWLTAQFWRERGASRLVLARELDLNEVAEIQEKGGLETELFVHGAICVSYSGRCLLSNYLTGRSANLGDCSQPCRWKYALVEEKRPGQYFPLEDDTRGGYILNSRDLCLFRRIPELLELGVDSWKIEGRNKSAYYVAAVTRAYRQGIDAALAGNFSAEFCVKQMEEFAKISNRQYTENFVGGPPDAEAFRYQSGNYVRNYDFVAVAYATKDGRIRMEQRNYFQVGDLLEILLPNGETPRIKVKALYDEAGNCVDAARHPREVLWAEADVDLPIAQPLICRKEILSI